MLLKNHDGHSPIPTVTFLKNIFCIGFAKISGHIHECPGWFRLANAGLTAKHDGQPAFVFLMKLIH